MTKWIESEELFKRELTTGYKWQLYVAEFLRDNNFSVDIPALEIREDVKDIPNFSNLPDILWGDKIFEVKSRNLKFSSPQDYPYETVIVDTVSSWRAKQIKPAGYICISTKTKQMICLSSHTKIFWTKSCRYDRTRDLHDWFYAAPKNLWVSISQMIKEMNSLLDFKKGIEK